MDKELLEEINKYNELTGNVYERSFMHKNLIWHRHVSVWLINQKGEVLLQKRSMKKRKNPGLWSKTGGHVGVNETPEIALQREIKEELGIEIPLEKIKCHDVYKNDVENFYTYNYIILIDYEEKDFILQKEEVDSVKYISLDELEKTVISKNPEYTFSKWPIEEFEYNIKCLREIINVK